MKRSKAIPITVLTLALLCCVAASGSYVLYTARQKQAIEERPLVLIHAPVNRDRVALDEGVPIHATARAEGGVSQIELWIDGAFVSVQETSIKEGVSPLVLVSSWTPPTLGEHVFVVRALSAAGVAGQASIVVDVVEDEMAQASDEAGSPGGDLPEGENPEGENPADGPSADEPSGGETPGDESPGGETPGDGGPGDEPSGDEMPGGDAPSSDEAPEGPPDGVGEPPDPLVPGAEFDLSAIELLLAGRGPGLVQSGTSDEPVSLRLEILALQAQGAYEALHCYLSIAGREPVWVPDTDGNQDTNESFARLAFGPPGRSAWNVAEHLSGDRALTTYWTSDQPLPIEVTCVGIAGGGTDAVELGRIKATAEPGAWDGVNRRLESTGGEGVFWMEYRITETPDRGSVKGIDSTMTSPENLTLDREGYLHWEYNPRTVPEPEEAIDGFRVFLNGSFQWVVPASARETRLPAQWLNPPCGDAYRFTVTAYHNEGCPADCRESVPSNERSIEGGESGGAECGRQVIVDFHTIATGNLGGDGNYDPGDMGPVYGWFYANDQAVFWDGRCVEGGRGERRCAELGFNHGTEYNAEWLATFFGGGANSRFVVDVPDGEGVTVAFTITDADTGRNNVDDLVCTGSHTFSAIEPGVHTLETSAPLGAPGDRCRATYSIQYVDGSPTIESGDALPLPLLQVEEIGHDESSNELQIRVSNVGTADWRHDLTLDLERRESGDFLGTRVFRNVSLPIGHQLLLTASGAPDRPMDACVVLDPDNQVIELGEEPDAESVRVPHCPILPDLVIDDVLYDSDRQSLLILISNAGDGALVSSDLYALLRLPDGDEIMAAPTWWENVTMRPGDPKHLEWPPPGVEAGIERDRLQDGYTIVLDPEDAISESDEDNNTFSVSPGVWLQVMWDHIEAPYEYRNQVQFEFSVDVLSGSGPRSIASWTVEQGIEWDSACDRTHDYAACSASLSYDTDWFYVAGDETLMIKSKAWHPGTLTYRGGNQTWLYRAENDWGEPQDVTYGGYCGDQPVNRRHWIFDQVPVGVNMQNWEVGFYYCLDRER